jgi:hypothetical protein
VGFIVTTLTGTNRAVVRFYNQRETAEQWIKAGKEATHWTWLSCHRFRANEVRLLLGIIAQNLGNPLRRFVLPRAIQSCSLTSLQQRALQDRGAAHPAWPVLGAGRQARLIEWRRQWLEGALQTTASADVVFLDPDNGLKGETSGHEARANRTAAEYAFLDELDPFLRRGQSVVVYQHQTRVGDMKTQARTWLRMLGQNLNVSPPWAVIFRLGLVRAYFVLPAERHREVLWERGQNLRDRWARYVELVGADEPS